MSTITDSNKTFECVTLKCKGMKYLACIRRQLAKAKAGYFKYPECAEGCKEGKKRKADHPELVDQARKLLKASPGAGIKKNTGSVPKRAFDTFYRKQPGAEIPPAGDKARPQDPEGRAIFRLREATPSFVSPEAADRLLQFNTYEAQRKPKERHLNELVKEMEAGLWRAAEVSVAVLPDGHEVLVNGQHTLVACMRSGREIFCFFVKYDVSGPEGLAALYMTFDLGRGARSIGDAVKAELHSLKLDWPLGMAAMISSAAASIESNSFRPDFGKAAQARFISMYRGEGQFIIDMFRGKAATYKHLKRSPVVRAMMATWRKYEKPATKFWRLVRDGEPGNKKTPANMLRSYLLKLPSPWDRKTLYGKCIVAFNAFEDGRPLRGLEYDPEDPLPEVGE